MPPDHKDLLLVISHKLIISSNKLSMISNKLSIMSYNKLSIISNQLSTCVHYISVPAIGVHAIIVRQSLFIIKITVEHSSDINKVGCFIQCILKYIGLLIRCF